MHDQLDICLEGSGEQTSEHVEHFVRTYPPFRPLALFLKVTHFVSLVAHHDSALQMFMESAGLDEVFTGGMGSFRLYCLIAKMLDTQRRKLGAHVSLSPGLFPNMHIFSTRCAI